MSEFHAVDIKTVQEKVQQLKPSIVSTQNYLPVFKLLAALATFCLLK